MSNDPLSSTFAALADPTRRAILERLAEGGCHGGGVAEPFAMTMPAISKHLSVLERAGLIVKSRDGQRPALSHHGPSALKNATSWLNEYRHHWEANLENLDAYLTASRIRRNDHEQHGNQPPGEPQLSVGRRNW